MTGLHSLPGPLHGQHLFTPAAAGCEPVDLLPGFACAATVAGKCVWQIAPGAHGNSHVAGLTPPLLGESGHLSEILNGESFLHALPVWLFLRELTEAPHWTPPPLRACLVVDDPNLHRPGYGHIDYQKLIDFSRTQPFHAAMATVPLDGWWVDSATARLFRDHAAVLSLLVHGNDHLHFELARPFSPEQQQTLVHQSLERTAAIDRKAGLAIDRVMAPPHGVCTPGMMGQLLRGGFAGLTTNRWSMWKHSPAITLPADSGFRPADWLAGGLPVVSRFRFNSVIGRNEIVLAALFGQPIVPYGHHQDFADDMAAVRETVTTVNALGPVRWMSMQQILETNFEQLVSGETLRLRLFSRHVKGTLAPGLVRLQPELPPAAAPGENVTVTWQTRTATGTVTAGPGESIPLPAGCSFEVRLAPPAPDRSTTALPAKPPLQVLLRRLASEVRDRLKL